MKNLYQALLKAQQEFGPVLKNATNPAYKSKYTDLSGVVETITETLHNNGLLVLQPTAVIDGENVVRTMVIHAESAECLESTYKVVTKDATDPQKVGAGLTYARRYALMAFFGLAPEDDDGNVASAPAPRLERSDSTRGQQSSTAQRTPLTPTSRTFDDSDDYPCEVTGCQNTQEGSWARTCYNKFGKVYCGKHWKQAKEGTLNDPKENIQSMSLEEELGGPA